MRGNVGGPVAAVRATPSSGPRRRWSVVKDLVAHIASWSGGALSVSRRRWPAPLPHRSESGRHSSTTSTRWRTTLAWPPWATVAAEASSSYAAFWKVEALTTSSCSGSRTRAHGQGLRQRALRAYVARSGTDRVSAAALLDRDLASAVAFVPASDAPSLHACSSIRRCAGSATGPTPTLARIRRAIDRQIGGERANGFSLYAVERRDGGELIGNSGSRSSTAPGPRSSSPTTTAAVVGQGSPRRPRRRACASVRRSGARARDRDLLSGQHRVAAGHGEGRDERRGMGEYYRVQMKKYGAERSTAGSHIAVSRSAPRDGSQTVEDAGAVRRR